jgi:hypothetical protein
MRTFLDTLAFAAGFGVCWLTKDAVVRFVTGTEGVVRSLEAKVALLKGKL